MRKSLMKCWLLSVVLFLPNTAAIATDNVMFRGNPQHTGVYDSGGVLHFSKIKWKFHTGGSVTSSPAVANGVVYVGSADHNLYALDSATGL